MMKSPVILPNRGMKRTVLIYNPRHNRICKIKSPRGTFPPRELFLFHFYKQGAVRLLPKSAVIRKSSLGSRPPVVR